MNSLWWLALSTLLLPIWWHRKKRVQLKAEPLATARFLPATQPKQMRVWRWSDVSLLVLRCLLLACAIAWLADPVFPWRGNTVVVAQGSDQQWVEREVNAAGFGQAARLPLPAATTTVSPRTGITGSASQAIAPSSSRQRSNSKITSAQRQTRICRGSVRGRKRALASGSARTCTRFLRCHQIGSSRVGKANHQGLIGSSLPAPSVSATGAAPRLAPARCAPPPAEHHVCGSRRPPLRNARCDCAASPP